MPLLYHLRHHMASYNCQFIFQSQPPPLPSRNSPRFVPVSILEDVQAIRCAEFHPNGKVFAVGSNSKTLRICQYPEVNNPRIYQDPSATASSVLFKVNFSSMCFNLLCQTGS